MVIGRAVREYGYGPTSYETTEKFTLNTEPVACGRRSAGRGRGGGAGRDCCLRGGYGQRIMGCSSSSRRRRRRGGKPRI